MRRIEIAKILRNESDFLAKYFLSKLSEIPNFNRGQAFGNKKSDWKSNLLVNIHSVDKVENCKHSQEEIDMHQRKVVEVRQPDIKRSYMKSDPSNEILSVDNAQGKLVEGEHTGIEKPDGNSNLSVNIHPLDIVENHRDSKEASESQVDSQATIIKYSSYSDKDQKGQIETKQLTMTNPTLR